MQERDCRRQAKLAAVEAAIETPALPLQRQQELRRQPLEPRWEERRADTLPLSVRRAAAERQQKALPPAEMKGVVMTRIEVEDIEEFSDMEGVELEGLCVSRLVAAAPTSAGVPQEVTREEGDGGAMEGIEREGLFASQHAPGLDAPVSTLAPARTEGGGKKDKGKAKAVLIATPPGAAASCKLKGSPRQLQRQAAVDFFFCLFITRVRPIRSWREYVQSVSCSLSARWRLVANTPFALRPGLSHEDVMRTNGITKEREASVTVEGKTKGRKTPPTPFLRTQWVGSVESLPRPAPSPPLLAPPAIPAPPLRKPR